MTPEKAFETKVKQFLKLNGCWFVKYWDGGAIQAGQQIKVRVQRSDR